MRVLLEIAQLAQNHLTDPRRPQANVSQWAKQVACWEVFGKVHADLDKDLIADLLEAEEATNEEKDARKLRSIDSGFEAIQRIINVAPQVWQAVVAPNPSASISPMEADLIREFGSKNGKVPSERQAQALIRMLDRFSARGVISKDAY
jgi:hypothetical protein